MAKNRIMYIAGTLNRGGAERQLVNQIRSLHSTDFEPVVVCPDSQEPLALEIAEMGVCTIENHAGSRLQRFRKTLEISRRIRPALIHSQHFWINLHSWAAGKVGNVPSIGSIQCTLLDEIIAVGRLGRQCLLRPDWMTANSVAAIENSQLLGRSSDKTFYLRNAVDVNAYRTTDDHSFEPWFEGRIKVICVGRLFEQKRIDRFLRLIKRTREHMPNVLGVVAGNGELRASLEQTASDLGLMPNGVVFLGERPDIASLLGKADIFVLTSDYEGMPNVVQEAMAAGKPVLATNVGATSQLISEGCTGFVVEPENENGLALRLLELVSDDALRRRMGLAGKEHAVKHFSLERLRSDLLTFYGKALHSS